MSPGHFLRIPSIGKHLASCAERLTGSQALFWRQQAVASHFCRDNLLQMPLMHFAFVEAYAQHFVPDRKYWQQQ